MERVVMFLCLWLTIDSVGTGWLLGLDKSCIISYWIYYGALRDYIAEKNMEHIPDYSRVCCDEEEFENSGTVQPLVG